VPEYRRRDRRTCSSDATGPLEFSTRSGHHFQAPVASKHAHQAASSTAMSNPPTVDGPENRRPAARHGNCTDASKRTIPHRRQQRKFARHRDYLSPARTTINTHQVDSPRRIYGITRFATLYLFVTGRPPFFHAHSPTDHQTSERDASSFETSADLPRRTRRHVRQDAPPPLAKEPEYRYQSAKKSPGFRAIRCPVPKANPFASVGRAPDTGRDVVLNEFQR